MPFDLYHNQIEHQLLAPQSKAAAFFSDPVDLNGFEACQVIVEVGAYTSGTFTVTLEDSDASGSGFAAAPADSVLPQPADPVNGDPASLTLDANAENSVFALGYLPYQKRYMRVKVTGTAEMYLSIVAVLGHPRYAPTR